MRIVAGQWRGRALSAPKGTGTTRPTTDRVREAVSSMLASARGLSLEGARVLDAFAGSGALGFELLSRGAAWCSFVDIDACAIRCLRANAAALGASSLCCAVRKANIWQLAAQGGLAGAPFDIVLLDPPYATQACAVAELVEALDASGSLAPGCLVLYERSAQAPALACAGFVCARQKRYGQTAADLLERKAEA